MSHFYRRNQILEFILYGLVPVDRGSSRGLFYWSCAGGPGLITRTVFVSVLSQDLDVMSFFLNDLK